MLHVLPKAKIMKKAKMTSVTTSIQYCTRSSSYCSKAKVGIKEWGRIKGGENGGREERWGRGIKEGSSFRKGIRIRKEEVKPYLYLQIP